MVRTTQKPNSSFVFCFAHLCPRSFLWARRAKFTRLGYGFRIMPPAHRGCHSSCQIKDLKRRHRSAPALCSTQIAWEPRLTLFSHTPARNFVNLVLLWNFLRKFLRRHGTDYTKAKLIVCLLFRTPMLSTAFAKQGIARLTCFKSKKGGTSPPHQNTK